MKKLKYNGFTLVELLAVIVILGAIALIITPVIRDTIDNSKKKNFINSGYQLVKAGELYHLENDMMEKETKEITFSFPQDAKKLNLKGDIPKEGQMTINQDGEIAIAISDGNYCIKKGYDENKIIKSVKDDECIIYEDESLNKASPIIKNGMIPVIIEADGTVKKTSSASKWYDYANKEWANAVTVTKQTRQKYINSDEGTIIKNEDILTYFVWIPRYKYKLWNTNIVDGEYSELDSSVVHSIDIIFEDKNTPKSNGSTNGEYLTHPAFTFGDEELNGFWVGKFETGYDENIEASSNRILIKPNTVAWCGETLKTSFYYAKNMNLENNIFGFGDDSDLHITKNIEWGAIAYLSHSKYGKDSEVYLNNNSGKKSGCGANSPSASSSSTCYNKYGTKYNNVYNQSTTGNISGIFDMSGGAYELVMIHLINSTNSYNHTDFTDETFPESKYVDFYNTSTYNNEFSKSKLGDAVGEMGPFSRGEWLMSSWYSDGAYMPTTSYSTVFRGGSNTTSDRSGIFTTNITNTSTSGSATFRIVIS